MPPVPRKPEARSLRPRNLLLAIIGACLVAAALIVASILTSRDDSADPPTASTTAVAPLLEGIPQNGTILGSPDATVRLLQFEDIQCPICKEYTDDAFPAIVEEYVRPGRVKIDFRGLAFLGPDSEKALRIVLAAGRQDRLWDVVELFYAEQREENSGWVTEAKVDEILAQVPGLDAAKVKADAKTAAVTKEIAAVEAEATSLAVQGTPWFYIGFGVNAPYEIRPQSLTPSAFRPALDDALQG